MAEGHDTQEGIFYKIGNYFYWFFIINFYFLICNLAFCICLLTLDFKFENIPFFFASLILTGPSLVALFSSMGKIYRDKEIYPTSYYFNSYKSNFKQGLKLWLIELSTVSMLLVDIKFFHIYIKSLFLVTLFSVLIFIILSIGLYAFPILARFEMKVFSIIKLSFYYMFKNFIITIVNIGILLALIFIFLKIPTISTFFGCSVAAYVISINNHKMFTDIQVRFIAKED